MTYAERIKRASGLPEAIAILAEGIDALLALKPSSSDDPWSAAAWTPPTAGFSAPVPEAKPVIDHQRIADLRAKVAAETDPETIQALMAQLRLAEDPGVVLPPRRPEGNRVQADVVANGEDVVGEVTLPTVPDEVKEDRRRWAIEARLPEYLTHLEPEQATEAFARGGPMWLYLGNRDVVMSMHEDKRRELVTMVEAWESPAQAHEMARDILKDVAPESGADSAINSMVAEHESRYA